MTDAYFAAESMNAEGNLNAPLLDLPPLDPSAGGGDTWIRVGDLEADEERTVTVVFRRGDVDLVDPLDDFETGEFLVRPLAPTFPGQR